MVRGLEHRTAPMAVRERFWIEESRRYEACCSYQSRRDRRRLSYSPPVTAPSSGLWTKDVTLAANSVMRLLGAEICSECASGSTSTLLVKPPFLHVSGSHAAFDSMVVGAPQIVPQ